MRRIYLGVDIGGDSATWICAIEPTARTLTLVRPPEPASMADIIRYAEDEHVLAVAIDAQLTWAVGDRCGFRTSDEELQNMLPPKYKNWVASQNSLMAVPVRGRQLAECLSPIVGTIIETHPRACLYLADKSPRCSVAGYKPKDGLGHCEKLWRYWCQRFHIISDRPIETNDALDSVVCATIAYLYHESPGQLTLLSHSVQDKRGRGPFVVLNRSG